MDIRYMYSYTLPAVLISTLETKLITRDIKLILSYKDCSADMGLICKYIDNRRQHQQEKTRGDLSAIKESVIRMDYSATSNKGLYQARKRL